MASWDIYSDNFDFLDMDFDEAAERALNEAAGVLEGAMRSAAAAAVKHDGESAMVNSIKGSKPKKVASTDCWIVNVGPRGYSSTKTYHGKRKGGKSKQTYKVSNALKAIWKEYGIPGHQSPQPFMQKATNQAQARVERIIEDAFNKEFEKYEL
jgi:HK97 gp10 family phage protein